jgi:carbamoyl-phosphate synthase large subunit
MNILITSAGQRVSLVRAFISELRQRIPGGKVFTTDMYPEISAACVVSDKFFKVKRVSDQNYIEDLISLCSDNDVKLIVPTIDTELIVLSQNLNLFKENGIEVMVSTLDFVSICRDKRRTNDFFVSKKIAIPQAVDKKNPVFPLFIKPYDGSLSSDNFIVRKNEDLTSYHMQNEKLMFMEYLDKSEYDEYTVDMYYDKHGYLKCLVPRKRIHIRAGEINKGVTCKNKIMVVANEFLGHIEGAKGCLTGQFFLNRLTGRLVGIEINARFGGGYPLSYRAGANYPGWMIEEYLQDKAVNYFDSWEDNLLMLRYDDEVLVHGYKN